MSKWENIRLGDFLEFNPRETLPKRKIAKKIPMENLEPFCRDVSKYEMASYNGGVKFRNNDTIMARITPCLENGKRSKVNILNKDEVGFGSTEFIVFREKYNISDSDFIYYLVCSDLIRLPAIKSMVGSSGRQRVQNKVLENLILNLPPLETQKKIAAVLGALDDKIELNNRINDNLEAQAMALFEEYFLNDLEFEEKTLGSLCECKLGGTPSRNKPEYWDGTIPWINSSEVNNFRIITPSEYITETGLKNSSTKLLPNKTTVIAITGATLGQVSLLEISSCANQSVIGILPNDDMPYEYIFPFIKSSIKELISHQTGGAQQHINKQNVEQLIVKFPLKNLMREYRKKVKSIYQFIANNCFENNYLSQLRDTLLPKLMSGEIDVSSVKI